jgi:hypothetical protein
LIHSKKDGVKKKMWRAEHFRPPTNPVFEPGIVDFSPGWFAQRFEVNKTLPLLFCRMMMHKIRNLEILFMFLQS